MNWFEKWFDSPLYEWLYANRDQKEATRLIDLLEETMNLHRCETILDLGCGRGRHSISLNERGYCVVGIDLSETAVQTARRKAEQKGLENLRFEVRDMREPLQERFDAILNLFTTFGYFRSDQENARVFDSVASMLEPDGIFVVDFLNAPLVRRSYRPEDSGEYEGIQYEIRRYIENDMIFKKITFSGDRLEEPRHYAERVKLYTLDWFREELGERGLRIRQVYGDYEGGSYDPEESSRLLMLAEFE
ncbi:MAG: class I SAM-dependent methyltransferase [Balneolaceae bacterium]|nr:class I SAM-dependent methyltransferase [Balneolaceae bacterium]